MQTQPVVRVGILFFICASLLSGTAFSAETTVEAQAQEPPTPPAEAPPAEAPPAETPPAEKKPFHIGIYVSAAFGSATADPLNTSLQTAARHQSTNTLEYDEFDYGRAELGWQLPNGKGDFRLRFNGYKEASYTLSAFGTAAVLPSGLVAPSTPVLEPLPWWTLTIQNGALHAERVPPNWDLSRDANGDGAVSRSELCQVGESCYVPADLVVDRDVTDNLLMQLQNIDLLYGREWGGRRFSGRWWAGLRNFEYEGNVLSAAWLNVAEPGEGYTDGTVLRLLNFHQRTEGLGPTGAMEADFNFFEKHLTLYLQGQVAYMLNKLEMDTGQFFTMINTETVTLPLADRLVETRDKSSWQTAGEIGARYKLDMGLSFELAWSITGYLDTVILPSFMQIPTSESNAAQGVSAVYSTQDLVFESWRFGVGYQF